MIVCKIIRTVLCCIVYHNCAVMSTLTWLSLFMLLNCDQFILDQILYFCVFFCFVFLVVGCELVVIFCAVKCLKFSYHFVETNGTSHDLFS